MKEKKEVVLKTSKLLDVVGEEKDYTNIKKIEKQGNYSKLLEEREPFRDIKRVIEKQERKIRKLEEKIQYLLKHQHDVNGRIVVDIEDIKSTEW